MDLEQVNEPKQINESAVEIEQVNVPELLSVPEKVNIIEQITQQEKESETIILDITLRRPSYFPEITLADITKELDISKSETLEIPNQRSILLEKSISSVIPRTQSLDISIHESVDDESIIYYKSREDFQPKIETLKPSASTNTAQRKRYSLYAALGTRIHPRSSLDDSKGMPVFQAPAPATVADKLKPKTMLKRLKTIVKNKKKSTTL
ncbi:hypothetical protein EDC94DRAFT_618403 [Helicostylum pulchrum]|nr:hypothetical protein EDC94DRAFT_618403 [Helicostylum pulchrum]